MNAKKGRRGALNTDIVMGGAGKWADAEGLRGYGKSGARVAALLNEKSA